MADQKTSSLPKVLIIVYDFPPEIGGGGVMRTVKFVKYLREFGWQPVVLTVTRRDTLMPDPGLLQEMRDTPIYRCPDWISRFNTPKLDNAHAEENAAYNKWNRLAKGLKNLVKAILIPDRRAGWLLPALLLGRRLVKNEGISVIYATAPPQTPLLVGYFLSIYSGCPLVVDYRDAWSGNKLFCSSIHLKNFLNRWLERRILNRTTLAIATTPALKSSLQALTTKSTVIYNGYDPEDFVGLSPRSLSSEKVNVVYLGGFDGYRTASSLAQAFQLLSMAERACLALHIIGPVSYHDSALLKNLQGVEINLVGTLPHRQALEYLIFADVLLLLIFPEEDSDRAIPGKIYEYLASGKPILALCEMQSALGQLLRDLGTGTIISPKNVSEIAKALKTLASDASSDVGEEGQLPTVSNLELFDRKKNTKKLAELFDEVRSSYGA